MDRRTEQRTVFAGFFLLYTLILVGAIYSFDSLNGMVGAFTHTSDGVGSAEGSNQVDNVLPAQVADVPEAVDADTSYIGECCVCLETDDAMMVECIKQGGLVDCVCGNDTPSP